MICIDFYLKYLFAYGRQVERNKTNDSLVVYFAVQLVTAFCTNSLSFDF